MSEIDSNEAFGPAVAMSSPTGEHGGRNAHLNASVVIIVVILCLVLFLSGLLHLLARCWGRRRRLAPAREHGPLVSVLHGQLQQLFHLHDAGVEQSFIDTLPVFAYGSIRGLKDGTDCAVCLTEFGDDDRLRLLPKCKHAFHLDCIDTWLLSNSTCPLCRRSLLPDPHLHNASSSRHRHSEQLLLDDASTSNTSPADPEPPVHPNTSRITAIASTRSLHGCILDSYHNSFRICNTFPSSSDHDEGIQVFGDETYAFGEETQAVGEGTHTVGEIHELDSEELLHLAETPSPFAPTIRVMDMDGTQRVMKVELGRVASQSSESRKLKMKGTRSYSMGSYEYIVDPASWELRMASSPTHRSALSDSIPEVATCSSGSAGATPAAAAASTLSNHDDVFWTSRGLYNPHTLSRVRELLTPLGSEGFEFSPFVDSASFSPHPGDRWIDAVDIERGSSRSRDSGSLRSSSMSRLPEEPKASTFLSRRSFESSAALVSDAMVSRQGSFSRRFSLNWLMGGIKQRSSSLSRLPDKPKASVVVFRRSLSETSAGMEQAVSALVVAGGGLSSSDCEEARKSSAALISDDMVKQQGSLSRRFSLNWLMGRDKRMVFAAASPVSVPDGV